MLVSISALVSESDERRSDVSRLWASSIEMAQKCTGGVSNGVGFAVGRHLVMRPRPAAVSRCTRILYCPASERYKADGEAGYARPASRSSQQSHERRAELLGYVVRDPGSDRHVAQAGADPLGGATEALDRWHVLGGL